MDENSRVPEPLQWSEGMPLAAQHFQQNDIYWHAVLRHQMAQLEPYYWGLIDLKLDESALLAGNIVVTALHAVMPDGLIVQFPAPDQEAALELDVSREPLILENKSVMVQLAVPVRAPGAASSASSIQRYDSAAGALAVDENTGEAPVAVSRLRARLSLQSGEQLPAKYVALPLLKVRRDLGGHFGLADYHPPMLRLGASHFLGEEGLQAHCENLATRIRHKAKELLGVTDETAPSIANSYQRQIVRQLTAALPAFELLARMPTTHPLRCYIALSQLAGQIAGVGADPMPLLLKPYVHNDAAPGFLQAIRQLSSVVAKLSAAYVPVVFERRQNNVFACELPPGLRPDRLIIELHPGKGQSAQAAEQWLQQARIGSAGMIALLRQRRIPGGQLQPLSAAEQLSLGAQSGCFYAIVNQAVQLEDKLTPVMQKDAELHIEGPVNATPPAAIVLYVKNPKRMVASSAAGALDATAGATNTGAGRG